VGQSAYLAETPDGQVVGFCAAGPSRLESASQVGECYAIYVVPEHQRPGIGRELLQRSFEALADQGMISCTACVFLQNPARGFFEALGGKWIGLVSSRRSGHKVAYAWTNIAGMRGVTDGVSRIPA
jgi:ribosomal protein S18 acetylase RimI-like enzyme